MGIFFAFNEKICEVQQPYGLGWCCGACFCLLIFKEVVFVSSVIGKINPLQLADFK